MKSRSKKTTDGPKNAIEMGSIPPPKAAEPTGFRSLTGGPKNWKTAGEALDRVRSIPTIFPDFDRATRIGGMPLRRIITIHGPTHGGKSAFIGGVLRSFVDTGNVGAYVDAEHATDLTFLDELFERPVEDIPNFFGMRPDDYEGTIDAVDDFLKWMVSEREARREQFRERLKLRKGAALPPLPPDLDLAGFMVIDSINKLVPKREIEKLKKEGGDSIDKGWGRLRAAFNQAFLDHVVPLLGKAETSLGVIVQEREDEDLNPWEMPKLKGGKATQYDASLIVRVLKSTEISRGDGKDRDVYGFRHKLRIWKSKVGHMDGRYSDAFFNMSNGTLVSPGFDTARDFVSIAKELGILASVEKSAWLTWKKHRWNGEHNAVVALSKDPAALQQLMEQVRAAIRPKEMIS